MHPSLILYVERPVSPTLRRRLCRLLADQCGPCTLTIRVRETMRTTYETRGDWPLRPGELHDRLGQIFMGMVTA